MLNEFNWQPIAIDYQWHWKRSFKKIVTWRRSQGNALDSLRWDKLVTAEQNLQRGEDSCSSTKRVAGHHQLVGWMFFKKLEEDGLGHFQDFQRSFENGKVGKAIQKLLIFTGLL